MNFHLEGWARSTSKGFLLGVSLAICIGTATSHAAAMDCKAVSPIHQARALRPSDEALPAVWAQYQQKIFKAQVDLTRTIFRSYLKGSFDTKFFTKCLGQEDRQVIDEVLPSTFIEESLALLVKTKALPLRTFAHKLRAQLRSQELFLFRLIGHLPEEPPPTTLPGGFHRGEGSVFMNFAKIPPNEWFVYLLHELLHGSDDVLSEAVEIYANQDLVDKLEKDRRSIGQLTSAEQKSLKTWARAGLDRGLLAEYRAWVLTCQFYLDGLAENLWKPIPWMDAILAKKAVNQPLTAFIFKLLDPNFTDSDEWPFTIEPVKITVKNLRTELRSSSAPPPLGNFTSLLPTR